MKDYEKLKGDELTKEELESAIWEVVDKGFSKAMTEISDTLRQRELMPMSTRLPDLYNIRDYLLLYIMRDMGGH